MIINSYLSGDNKMNQPYVFSFKNDTLLIQPMKK